MVAINVVLTCADDVRDKLESMRRWTEDKSWTEGGAWMHRGMAAGCVNTEAGMGMPIHVLFPYINAFPTHLRYCRS